MRQCLMMFSDALVTKGERVLALANIRDLFGISSLAHTWTGAKNLMGLLAKISRKSIIDYSRNIGCFFDDAAVSDVNVGLKKIF